MVGDLIGRHASAGETPLRELVQRNRAVLIRAEDLAAFGAVAESGAGLDRQLIKREMRSGKAQCLIELVLPSRDALPGTCIDQVERVAREGVAGERDRGERLRAIMAPTKKLQRRQIKRLHAERQAIDARDGEFREALGLGGIRVGFECHFEVGRRGP